MPCPVSSLRRELESRPCRRWLRLCATQFMQRRRKEFGRCRFWANRNMNRLQVVRFIAVLIFLVSPLSKLLSAQNPAGSSIQPASAVPASRVAHLRHGINASEWFAQVYDKRGYTKEHFQDWTTAEDIALMKSMGFDHVRLSLNPQPMMPNHRPDEISAEYFV